MRNGSILIAIATTGLLASCNGGQRPDSAALETAATDSIMHLAISTTDSVQNILKAKLVKAMQDSGAAYAIRFCNVEATGLTASLNETYGIRVARLSHRNRNEANVLDADGKIATDEFASAIGKGQDPKPKLARAANGAWVFYRPIVTGPVCLTCHGQADQLMPEVQTALAALYPNDIATGFVAGELRGVWRVTSKPQTLNFKL